MENISKTASSRLLELCVFNGIRPEFTLQSVEGVVHEPNFNFRVCVEDMTAFGSARSKKLAKQIASNELLKMIVLRKDLAFEDMDRILLGWDPNETVSNEKQIEKEKAAFDIDFNPVGRVGEFCAKRKVPQPAYEEIKMEDEQQDGADRVFTISCLIQGVGDDMETLGIAKTKKAAKREAAMNMYRRLEQLDLIGTEPEKKAKSYVDWDESLFGSNLSEEASVVSLLNHLEGLKSPDGGDGDDKKSVIREILDLVNEVTVAQNWDSADSWLDCDTAAAAEDSFYWEKVQKISEHMNCSLETLPVKPALDDPSKEKPSCFIHLYSKASSSTTPLLTSWGSSDSSYQSAVESAAKCALTLLPILLQGILGKRSAPQIY